VASSAVAPISSPKLGVAIIPACSNNASLVTSGVVADEVWVAAARCPASLRPAWTVITGIRAPTRRAVRANLRGLPNDSM